MAIKTVLHICPKRHSLSFSFVESNVVEAVEPFLGGSLPLQSTGYGFAVLDERTGGSKRQSIAAKVHRPKLLSVDQIGYKRN